MINSLSIVLPVYNESERINITIKEIKKFLKKNIFNSLEIIFVDDGSQDDSLKKIDNFINNYKKKKKVKILRLKSKSNLGKGSALKLGVNKSTKEWILTIDIDMSVKLTQINNWIKKGYIKNKKTAYFASRNHINSKVTTKFYRFFLGSVFKIIIFLVLRGNLKDTQCGFKLYNKKYAKAIFKKLRTAGYAHDLELINLLKIRNIDIIYLPVIWVHKQKGKLNLIIDPIKMLIDIIKIKFFYQN